MTSVYFAKQRTWFLLPFNSIHHRYYRADSQVLSFFLYNSSCFISTLCSHDPPSPCLLLGKSITGAQFYLVWRLKGAPQIIQLWWVSLRGSFVLYSSKIWYFFFIWQSCKQDLHPPSFTACARFPLLISRQQKTSDIKKRGEGVTTVYCIKMYSGFYWHTFHRLNSCKIGGTPSIALH